MVSLRRTLASCCVGLFLCSCTDDGAGSSGPCRDVDCGHGICAAVDGEVACFCAAGYTGPTCHDCAAGFQDRDGDGTCAVSCEAVTCAGPHQRCDDATGEATCACASGYADVDNGTGCAWAGLLADPEFQSHDAWTASGGAVIVTGDEGWKEPGLARFMEGRGVVAQTVVMPALADAEPLELSFASRSGGDGDCGTIQATVGRTNVVAPVPPGEEGWEAASVCLGEAAFGVTGPLAFRLIAVDYSYCEWAGLDAVRIAPRLAWRCPHPGEVLDGDLEGGGAGWTIFSATVTADGGYDDSRALRFAPPTVCDWGGQASVPFSVPSTAVENPALRFRVWATEDARLEFGARNLSLYGEVAGTGSWETLRACLPRGLLGTAAEATFHLAKQGGFCSTPDTRVVLLDDLAIVAEPDCAGGAILDGGFERMAPSHLLPFWHLTSGDGAAALIEHDPSGAHGGERVLALRVTRTCAFTRASTWVTVPPPDGGGGPAIRFWHRGTAAPDPTFGVLLNAGGRGVAAVGLEVAPAWTQETLCVPPTLGGVAARLVIEHGVYGTCGSAVSGDKVFLDDIELTTDPSCPVE